MWPLMAPQAMDINMAPGWGMTRDLHMVLSIGTDVAIAYRCPGSRAYPVTIEVSKGHAAAEVMPIWTAYTTTRGHGVIWAPTAA